MSAAEKKSGFDTPGVVFGAGAVLVLVLALSLFLQGGFHHAMNRQVEAKVYDAPVDEERTAYEAEQQALLNDPAGWLDKEQGRLRLPIEDAMEKVVARAEGGN